MLMKSIHATASIIPFNSKKALLLQWHIVMQSRIFSILLLFCLFLSISGTLAEETQQYKFSAEYCEKVQSKAIDRIYDECKINYSTEDWPNLIKLPCNPGFLIQEYPTPHIKEGWRIDGYYYLKSPFIDNPDRIQSQLFTIPHDVITPEHEYDGHGSDSFLPNEADRDYMNYIIRNESPQSYI